jgi:hypothetical protein
MTQLIYAISALGIVALIALSMQRSSGSSEQQVYTNEVLTQLVSIGRDVVDDIARQDLPFDATVDPERLPSSATYPYVHGESELTAESDFGGCHGADLSTCEDIDDFHYRDGDDPISGERNGLEYEATISVKYVDVDSPNDDPSHASGKSFAKQITVTVESAAIQVNGEPISASYSRVLTYPRITNYTY